MALAATLLTGIPSPLPTGMKPVHAFLRPE